MHHQIVEKGEGYSLRDHLLCSMINDNPLLQLSGGMLRDESGVLHNQYRHILRAECPRFSTHFAPNTFRALDIILWPKPLPVMQ